MNPWINQQGLYLPNQLGKFGIKGRNPPKDPGEVNNL